MNITTLVVALDKSVFMKNLSTIFIMAAIFSALSGFKSKNQNSVYPPEKFSVVEAKLSNGKPVVGSINMGYKSYTHKEQYPWCLTLNIALDLNGVYKNGLPLKSESDIANKFEDELINSIRKITTAHYICHLYNDTFFDVYIYLDHPEKVNEYLKNEVNKPGLIRGFAYKIERDPNWTTVDGFLK